MTTTPVTDLRTEIDRMETAYEFLISFAGQGVGRDAVQSSSDQLNEYVTQFQDALGEGFSAAEAIPATHGEFDTDAYGAFVDEMTDEVEEARTILALLGEQETITSAQVDNMNGMSVFQSVMMKFFFLDELTDHLERDEADADSADADSADAGDTDEADV